METRRRRRMGARAAVAATVMGVLMSGAAVMAAGPVRVDELRSRARELVLKQAEMGWGSWVLGEASNQATLYAEYEDLFTRDSIRATQGAFDKEKDSERQRALQYFRLYQEMEFVGKQTAILSDIASDLEAELTVVIDGKSVPYHDLPGMIANEPDAGRRAEMAREEYRVFSLQNKVVLGRLLSESHRLAKELGYTDYLAMAAAARMIDVDALGRLCREVLETTREDYYRLFDEVSPIPRAKFHRSDIGRVLGAKEYDALYAKDKLVSSLRRVFSGMGLDLGTQANIRIHDEPLPKKNPRAVCFAVRVPEDVRVSIKPQGGKDDFSALFHEFGHAEHFGNAKTKVWEFQQLGSNAVTEGYAYLFESVPEDPVFLTDVLGADDKTVARLRRHAAFSRLYMLRRFAAKVLYETDLHRGAGEPAAMYKAYLSDAYGFTLTDEESSRCLSDVDAFLYSADYVQAFYLEAMLRSVLAKRFGAPWWKQPGALAFLRDLWAEGNKLSGTELAQRLGFAGLSTPLVLEDFRTLAGN